MPGVRTAKTLLGCVLLLLQSSGFYSQDHFAFLSSSPDLFCILHGMSRRRVLIMQIQI